MKSCSAGKAGHVAWGSHRNGYYDHRKIVDHWEYILSKAMDEARVLLAHHDRERMLLEVGGHHAQRLIHHTAGHVSLREQTPSCHGHRGAE